MKKLWCICFVFFLLIHSLSFANLIDISNPKDFSGNPSCEIGYSLIEGVCVADQSLLHFNSDDIATAIIAYKSSTQNKQHTGRIAGESDIALPSGIPAYSTFIEERESNILKLRNGATAKVPFQDLWHASGKRGCILFKEGAEWKLWIIRQDPIKKQLFTVELLEEPEPEPTYVTSVSQFLELTDQHF